jgi:hypothetical protein
VVTWDRGRRHPCSGLGPASTVPAAGSAAERGGGAATGPRTRGTAVVEAAAR